MHSAENAARDALGNRDASLQRIRVMSGANGTRHTPLDADGQTSGSPGVGPSRRRGNAHRGANRGSTRGRGHAPGHQPSTSSRGQVPAPERVASDFLAVLLPFRVRISIVPPLPRLMLSMIGS
jgi:hypothetical protein